MEGLVEARRQPVSGDGALVTGAPAFQRLRIIEAVALAVQPGETCCFGNAAEAFLADQQTTGEDVGLDEIRIRSIALEQFVAVEMSWRAALPPGFSTRAMLSR